VFFAHVFVLRGDDACVLSLSICCGGIHHGYHNTIIERQDACTSRPKQDRAANKYVFRWTIKQTKTMFWILFTWLKRKFGLLRVFARASLPASASLFSFSYSPQSRHLAQCTLGRRVVAENI
jgi:hypothetical protein